MESYVGLDVSLRRTSICVVDQTGKVLCEGTVNSTPEAIVEFVKSKAAGAVRIGLETGPTSTWLWTEIKAHGIASDLYRCAAREGRAEDADQQERSQ